VALRACHDLGQSANLFLAIRSLNAEQIAAGFDLLQIVSQAL
jgi:hypothetical protein